VPFCDDVQPCDGRPTGGLYELHDGDERQLHDASLRVNDGHASCRVT